MCWHVLGCVCLCLDACGCQRSSLGVNPSEMSTYCLEALSPNGIWSSLGQLLSKPQGSSYPCLTNAVITGVYHYVQLFTDVLGLELRSSFLEGKYFSDKLSPPPHTYTQTFLSFDLLTYNPLGILCISSPQSLVKPSGNYHRTLPLPRPPLPSFQCLLACMRPKFHRGQVLVLSLTSYSPLSC